MSFRTSHAPVVAALVTACALAGCRPAPEVPAAAPAIAPARAPAMVDPIAAQAPAQRVDARDAALARTIATRLAQALGPAASGTLQVRVQAGAASVVPLPGSTARAADVQAALRGVPGIRALDTRALP